MKNIKDVIVSRMEHRGVSISSLVKKTGIPYMKLYKSLAANSHRELFVGEFLMICEVLELTLADFVSDNTSKE